MRTSALAHPALVRIRACKNPSESGKGDSIMKPASTASCTLLKIGMPILRLRELMDLRCLGRSSNVHFGKQLRQGRKAKLDELQAFDFFEHERIAHAFHKCN